MYAFGISMVYSGLYRLQLADATHVSIVPAHSSSSSECRGCAKQDKHLILNVGKCCYNSTEMSGDSKRLDSIRRVWEFPMSRSAETEFQDDTPCFSQPALAGFVSFVPVLIDECKLISIKLHLKVTLSQKHTEPRRRNLACSQPTQKRITAHVLIRIILKYVSVYTMKL